MLIFPIRHHSPAAALQLHRLIHERRPALVLVEGPSDADSLIPFLLDSATVPPVAIYAYPANRGEQQYRQQNERSLLYPLCDYSPELVALKAGHDVGASLHFCDVPARTKLAWDEEESEPSFDTISLRDKNPTAAHLPAPDFTAELASRAGYDSFESFWEASFEQSLERTSLPHYLDAYREFGSMARETLASAGFTDRDGLREQYMASLAVTAIANGTMSEKIVLVCGAAHADSIAMHIEAGATMPVLSESVPTELALVPYSFPRLSEDAGYGAGNRAPWFYQHVWKYGGDYTSASRRTFVALAQGLRTRGYSASLAQEIDADELAAALAGIRGKQQPGVDEVVDASIACFGQGRSEAVSGVLNEVLVGDSLGKVSAWAGRTPLQSEFYQTAEFLKMPVVDSPRQLLVHLPEPREAAQSVFLHRLVAAGIPYGKELESGIFGGGREASGGPLAGLARAREKWEICWTPVTDARLVDQNAWGSTLSQVCDRLLRRRLDDAIRIDDGTELLLQLALCDLPGNFQVALTRCEALAADNGSFASLARAAFHLDGLLSFGAARSLPRQHLTDLATRLFVRATLQLSSAAECGDEAATEIEQTLLPLADLVRRDSLIASGEQFWQAIQTMAAMEACHPTLRGLALTLMELEGKLGSGEMVRRLRLWLVAGQPEANAKLIAGLFSLRRGSLIRNRSLIAAVTEFLLKLDVDQLIPLLPALRRTLGDLSPSERVYLNETLSAIFSISHAETATFELSEDDLRRLSDVDAAVANVLNSWKERYGIG